LRNFQRSGEAWFRHADDGEGCLVDDDGLTDDARIEAEAPLPEVVGDHRHRRRVQPIVGRRDRPADRRGRTEALVVIARYVLTRRDFRVPSNTTLN
jgi:hypothetical protein